MTNKPFGEDLESVISSLKSNGWAFQQDENGLHYSFNHKRRIITFRYGNAKDLAKAILSDVLDDPGAYEVHFNLPIN